MAEGRGWHGGRVIGRGRDTPLQKREAATPCGALQPRHSPSTHLARTEPLACPGQSPGAWEHRACYT